MLNPFSLVPPERRIQAGYFSMEDGHLPTGRRHTNKLPHSGWVQGHSLMRFTPPGSASLKDLPRSPHPTPFAKPTVTSG